MILSDRRNVGKTLAVKIGQRKPIAGKIVRLSRDNINRCVHLSAQISRTDKEDGFLHLFFYDNGHLTGELVANQHARQSKTKPMQGWWKLPNGTSHLMLWYDTKKVLLKLT